MLTELKLQIVRKNGRSIIGDSYFTSPLKLGTPDAERDRLNVVFMMASAGILKGDEFVYDIRCGEGTKTLMTDQSYTKIFDTGPEGAKKSQYIRVERGASLYYNPCAVIPFAGSSYEGELHVELDRDSEFACTDILAAGRTGMGEKFAFRSYRNRICVEMDGIPVWMDHCFLHPAHMELESMFFFDGFTHQGTFYYYGPEEKQRLFLEWYQEKREKQESGMGRTAGGITEARKGICLRVLARTAQDIEEIFAGAAGTLGMEQ